MDCKFRKSGLPTKRDNFKLSKQDFSRHFHQIRDTSSFLNLTFWLLSKRELSKIWCVEFNCFNWFHSNFMFCFLYSIHFKSFRLKFKRNFDSSRITLKLKLFSGWNCFLVLYEVAYTLTLEENFNYFLLTKAMINSPKLY